MQIMLDNIFGRVRSEAELLMLVMAFSLVSSSWLVIDASISLAREQYSWALMAFRVLELVFGALWLSFSARMAREVARLRSKHFRVFSKYRLERLDVEQKKSMAADSVRDMLAFYRGYYRRVSALLVLAVAVSLSIILASSFLLLYGRMSIWEAVFRWGINSSMLLIASVLYIHLQRNWGGKLLKVEDAEKKFSIVLGGPIEP